MRIYVDYSHYKHNETRTPEKIHKNTRLVDLQSNTQGW